MDPLSLSASVIAVVTAVSACVSHAKRAYNAPQEITQLAHEVEDISLVVSLVNCALQDRRPSGEATELNTAEDGKADSTSSPLSKGHAALVKLLGRLHGNLSSLETLLRKSIKTDDKDAGVIKFRRLSWNQLRPQVEELRRQLLQDKTNLSTGLNAATSADIFNLLCKFDGFNAASPTNQVAARAPPQSPPAFHLEIDRTPGLGISEGPKGEATPDTSPRMTAPLYPIDDTSSEKSQMKLQRRDARRSSLTKQSCPGWCSCVCHGQKRLGTPRALQSVVGSVSIGYSASLIFRQPCNERLCKRKLSNEGRVTYTCPPWLCSRVISLMLWNAPVSGPSFNLRTLRVVPDDAKVFSCAEKGDVDEIRNLFIEGQASIWDVDSAGQSLLDMAFNRKHFTTCKYLLTEGVDPFIEDQSGWSVIADAWEYAHQNPAIFHSHLSIFHTSDLDTITEEQQLPTIIKIVLGLIPLDLPTYLSASTAIIDDTDSYNRTAIYWACSRGDDKTARILLDHSADIHIAEKTGLTTLHIANSALVVRMLLAAGADPSRRDAWDRTPLHWAAYQGKPASVLEALLDGGADVDAPRWNSAGYAEAALHMAADFGRVDLVECFLARGATVDLRPESRSMTPLETAVWRNKPDVLALLVRSGAAWKGVDWKGRSLLHVAAVHAEVETLEALIQNGVGGMDAEMRDASGKTAGEVLSARGDSTAELVDAFRRLLEVQTVPEEPGLQRFSSEDGSLSPPLESTPSIGSTSFVNLMESVEAARPLLDGKTTTTPLEVKGSFMEPAVDEVLVHVKGMPGSFLD